MKLQMMGIAGFVGGGVTAGVALGVLSKGWWWSPGGVMLAGLVLLVVPGFVSARRHVDGS